MTENGEPKGMVEQWLIDHPGVEVGEADMKNMKVLEFLSKMVNRTWKYSLSGFVGAEQAINEMRRYAALVEIPVPETEFMSAPGSRNVFVNWRLGRMQMCQNLWAADQTDHTLAALADQMREVQIDRNRWRMLALELYREHVGARMTGDWAELLARARKEFEADGIQVENR